MISSWADAVSRKLPAPSASSTVGSKRRLPHRSPSTRPFPSRLTGSSPVVSQPDPDERYATTADLKADLDRLDDEGHPLPGQATVDPQAHGGRAAALLTVLLAGTWWLAASWRPASPSEPISVLVADFVNRDRRPSFDGALEQTLAISMEGASFISAFPPANARKIADQLEPGSSLDEDMARLISRREGVSVILIGTLISNSDGGDTGFRCRPSIPGSRRARRQAAGDGAGDGGNQRWGPGRRGYGRRRAERRSRRLDAEE